MTEMEYRILELFSGIGGMHYAFDYAKLAGEVITAIDINDVANAVYAHNYPSTTIRSNNIQNLKAETIKQWQVNMILMSPPCQPHTRVGHQRDLEDPRSEGFRHFLMLLPQCTDIDYVFMENVKGFEKSQARDEYIKALQSSGFFWREFILSPHQLGVPNTRHRYYCLARRREDFKFEGNHIWQHLPHKTETAQCTATINDVLEHDSCIPSDAYVPLKMLLKYAGVFDIVTRDSTNSMCFTKAYTRYGEGTGSILSVSSTKNAKEIYMQLKQLESDSSLDSEYIQQEKIKLLQELQLRYFTPREVARLMSFPESLSFPENITVRQQYRLLGNSINIKIVGELLKLLCS